MRFTIYFFWIGVLCLSCSKSRIISYQKPHNLNCDKKIVKVIQQIEKDMFQKTDEYIPIDKSGMNLLHQAARSGDIDIVKCLLVKKYPINSQDKRGNSPLHYALINGQLAVARLLIEKGADVTVTNKLRQSTIHMVVLSVIGTSVSVPSIDPLKGRISSPFGIRLHPIFGTYQFHNGIDIAAPAGKKIIATSSGRVMRFRYKPGIGKVIVLQHSNGFQTIYGHCRGLGKLRMGRTVPRGYTIGKVGSTGNSTGPHLHYEIVYNGQPINAYHYLATGAQEYNIKEIVALLVAKGVNINNRDRAGRAPIHYAANRAVTAIQGLVQNGASVNVYDHKGLAPIHYAAFSSVVSAKYLLRCKANVNSQTKKIYKHGTSYYPRGITPLKIALKNEWLQMAKLFLRYGGR